MSKEESSSDTWKEKHDELQQAYEILEDDIDSLSKERDELKEEMEEKDPEKILWKAVYGMLPKNKVC